MESLAHYIHCDYWYTWIHLCHFIMHLLYVQHKKIFPLNLRLDFLSGFIILLLDAYSLEFPLMRICCGDYSYFSFYDNQLTIFLSSLIAVENLVVSNYHYFISDIFSLF